MNQYAKNMETDTIKITKLVDQKQWTTWKFQVTIILKSSEVWNIVAGVEKPPKENVTDYDKLLAAHNKKDISAQRILITTLGEKPLSHIITCESAAEMWSKLESVFEQKTSQGIHFLQQTFFTIEKGEDENVANFISRLEQIVKNLSDLDTVIPDTMVMTKILTALPSSFNHFHSAWESTSEQDKNLTNLRTRLMIEEKRMEIQESAVTSGALLARKAKRKSHSNFKDKSNKKPGNFFICDKDTRWKKDCPLRNKSASKALVVLSECMVAQDYNNMWFLDSGATEHMSKRREWFSDYVKLSVPHPVRIGNGELINAIGKGNIEISSFNGEKWIKRYLSNALHVPDLQACDKKCLFVSNDKHCEFVNLANGEIVAM